MSLFFIYSKSLSCYQVLTALHLQELRKTRAYIDSWCVRLPTLLKAKRSCMNFSYSLFQLFRSREKFDIW